MYYATQGLTVPVYELDEEGNIVYITDDEGIQYPVETGEYKTTFNAPLPFKGAIFSQLKDGIMRAYGADNTNNYAVLVVDKKYNEGLKNGTRIWLHSAIGYNADGTVDENTADYRIDGVMVEELNETSFYLQVLSGDGDA